MITEEPTKRAVPPGQQEPVNILLVDDDLGKLLTYEAILSDLGENLVRAPSGRDALDLLLKSEFAVILVDVCMPELDGFELVEMIRGHPRLERTAVIFVSGVQVSDIDRIRGYASGAVDYVAVPIIPEILRAKVSVFIDLFRKSAELERLNRDLEQRVRDRTSELAETVARLAEKDATLSLAMRGGCMGAWSRNLATDEVWWSPELLELFGKTAESFQGNEEAFFQLVHPEDREPFAKVIENAVVSRTDYIFEFRFLHGSGEWRWMEGRGSAVYDDRGAPLMLHGIGIDITERKHSADALRESEEREKLLGRIARDLGGTLDSLTIFRRLKDGVVQAIAADGLIVSSFDERDLTIRCEYIWVGGNELDPASLPPLPLGPEGAGMQSRVIRSAKPLLIEDVEQRVKDPRSNFIEIDKEGQKRKVGPKKSPKSRSGAMVPLVVDGKVRGVVQVMSNRPCAYSHGDLDLLEGIATQLTLALENAKLYALAQEEIAERRKTEGQLRGSEAFTRSVIEASSDCVEVLDIKGNVESINARGQILLEIDDLSKFLGIPYVSVWPEESQSLVAQVMRKAAKGEDGRFQAFCPTLAGVPKWWDVAISPVRDEAGKVVRILAVSRDITAQQTEAEKLERLVQERTSELTSVAYSLAHDMRQYARGVNVNASMLKIDLGHALTKETSSYLERLKQNAKLMSQMVDDILTHVKLGRQTIRIQQVDLSFMAAEEGNALALAPSEGLPLDLEVEPDLKVRGDPTMLRLVLQNLLSNAQKFSLEGQTPKAKLGRNGDGSYYLADSGMGFEPEHAEKLFQPFERLHGQERSGTGIGLANVRRVIEIHGGRVWAESKGPGKGATFHFTLP